MHIYKERSHARSASLEIMNIMLMTILHKIPNDVLSISTKNGKYEQKMNQKVLHMGEKCIILNLRKRLSKQTLTNGYTFGRSDIFFRGGGEHDGIDERYLSCLWRLSSNSQ